MLFTRCPDCDTTFRVTDEALQKANGQVRCGRCASVFNAYAERRDPPPDQKPAVRAAVARTPPTAAAAPAIAPRESLDDLSVAAVVAQVDVASEEDAETGELEIGASALPVSEMSAEQVQHVLETDALAAADWPATSTERGSRNRWWSVASALALATLGLQTVHHFRADLAGRPVIGPALQQTYGMLGATVTPRWDVGQYRILDWIATAEPNARGQGSLKITARVHNRGPSPHPYPSIHLRLKDRWEAAVGSRVFSPREYLRDAASADRLMAPGETARAELEVVDPGPDAYGFELDVCIEVETDVLSCGTDEIFL
jgi:predicted Zn finger-like uncharacterized protein